MHTVQSFYKQALGRIALSFCTRACSSPDDRRFLRQVSHKAVLDNAREWSASLRQRYTRHARLMDVPSMLADPEVVQEEEALEGFSIIRQIKLDIPELAKPPTDFQMGLIWFIVQLMAPRIFGQAWATDRVRIKREMGWTDEHLGIGAVLTGRKEGKSTGMAMACALLLLNLKNFPIALFSRTREQARIILGMTRELLIGHPRVNQFRFIQSGDILKLRASLGDEREIRAWSGQTNVSVWEGREGTCRRHRRLCKKKVCRG